MCVFFTIFFIITLLFAGWMGWCTKSYRIGVYHDKYGIQHEVPLVQYTPADWELDSIKTYIEIIHGIGKGKSITI